MRAGKLRHRITLQTLTTSADAFGAAGTDSWANTITNEPASIEPLSGMELMEAMKIDSKISHKLTIRYRSGITPALRAVFGTRTFDIASVLTVDEKNHEINMLCKEVL